MKYHTDDKETLKALKMQEGDLARLSEKNERQHQDLQSLDERLEQLKARTRQLASDEGIAMEERPKMPAYVEKAPERMSLDEVPSWDDIVARMNQEVKADVKMEDLLSTEEINYSLDEVKRINDDFARRTGLTSRDMAFLTLATSIQTARWMMMPKLLGKMSKSGKVLAALSPSAMAMLDVKPKTGTEVALADEVNKEFQEEVDWEVEEIKEGRKSWQDILETGTANAGQQQKAFNNEAMNWIFGIVNNITGTKTNGDFTSIDTASGEKIKTPGVFAEAFRSIKEDPMRLPAAVYAQYAQDQAAHGKTADLLAPVTQAFSPEMVGDLYKSQAQQLASLQSLTVVGQQAAIPLMINMAVGVLHGFMYNPATDGPREFYDARTRKILLISNLLATSSNIGMTAATEKWLKLDVGGLLVTATRAMQDVNYLTTLKDNFMKEHMDQVLLDSLQDIDRHFNNQITPVEH